MTQSHTPLWTLDSVQLDGDRHPRLDVEHLEIRTGCTAIIGASGAGKTSLLNLLVGFEAPSRGQIASHLNRDPNRLPLFWIPPDGGLWPQATTTDHLGAVHPKTDHQPTVGEILQAFGLSEQATSRPDTLSNGERSRLAAARGLAAGATVLVADEPFVHVDPLRLDNDWDTLVNDSRNRDTSLIFSTHSPRQVLRHADHVVVLSHGRVVADGDVTGLYRSPPSREVASSLGPANWFPATETSAWGVGNGDVDICLRPEQIELVADPNGTAVVVDSKTIGPLRETRLTRPGTDDSRTLTHLSGPAQPVPTGTVRITAPDNHTGINPAGEPTGS